MAEYRLTAEGKEYLEKGLPEKNLVDLLNKYPQRAVKFTKAVANVKNFHIALKWAMEKGWVTRREDELILLKYPEKIPEEEALERVAKGKPVEEKILQVLLQRNLVEKIVAAVEELAGKVAGKEITELTPELLKTGLWKTVKFVKYTVDVPPKKVVQIGKKHPYRQVIEEVRERLIGLGFVEARGPYVEMNFWNADALFMPSDHPARSIHDVFSVKNPKKGKVLDKKIWERVGETHKTGWITGSKGWGMWDFQLAQKLLLRSHNTAVSARALTKLKKEDMPCKLFVIDRVFRPEAFDAKHSPEFFQCEGIVCGEGLNLKHLLGYLREIALAVTGAEKVHFKPSYFPFTEPSIEGLALHPKLGWFEFGGAGIFRPEVTLPLGVEVPVLAWGLGLDRLAMVKLGVDDIRFLYTDNLQWLREKSLVI
jgi:phenylalanyl-tRNA synthetase alpha chain